MTDAAPLKWAGVVQHLTAGAERLQKARISIWWDWPSCAACSRQCASSISLHSYHTIDHLEERCVERGSTIQSSLTGWKRATVYLLQRLASCLNYLYSKADLCSGYLICHTDGRFYHDHELYLTLFKPRGETEKWVADIAGLGLAWCKYFSLKLNIQVCRLRISFFSQNIWLALYFMLQVYLCHNKPPLKSPLPPNVQQKPGICSVSGSTVTLNNGDNISVDCLLFCTGYHFSFPFLTDSCHLHIEEERVTPLYKHLIHTEFPTLSFIGICKTICPFPQFYVQVQLVLAVLDGSCQLPSKEEMDADTEADFQKRLSEGLPKRHAHTMGNRQWAYNDEIAQMAGCQYIPKVVKNLYDAVHDTRAVNLLGYKKGNFKLIDGENFVTAWYNVFLELWTDWGRRGAGVWSRNSISSSGLCCVCVTSFECDILFVDWWRDL